MTAIFILVQLLILFGAVTNAASFCPVPQYCVASNIVQNDTIEISITSSATGYVAFGIGTGMQGADIMIAWIDPNTQIGYVSDHWATGYVRPSYDSQQDWTMVQSSISGSNRTIVARRLLVTTDKVADQPFRSGSRSYVYAFADQPVLGPPTANKPFEKHKVKGTFKLDLFNSTATGGTSSGLTYADAFLAHGTMMFLAWGVFSYAGIYLARFMKVVLGVWWYRLHVGFLLGGTGCLTVAAFVLAVVQLEANFQNLHHMLGLILVSVMVLQMILGKVIDALWRPNRREVPIRDKLHWWTGRFLVVLSIVTIITGLFAYDAPIYVIAIFCLWIIFVLGVFIVGERRFGQSHHPVGADSDEAIR